MIKWILLLAMGLFFGCAEQSINPGQRTVSGYPVSNKQVQPAVNNKEIVPPEPSVLGYVYPSYQDNEIISNYLKLHPQADTVLYVNSKKDTITAVTKHLDYRKTQDDISSISTALWTMTIFSIASVVASVVSIIVVAVHK